jgi:hypothetical protein
MMRRAFRQMTGSWAARQRVAAVAILVATTAAAAVAALGGSAWHVSGAGAYITITVLTLFFPAVLTVQVIAGQVIVASVLLGRPGPAPLLLLPVVASVVATAELLALVGRLNTPVERDPRHDLHRTGSATAIGGGAFAAVVLLGGLPGPTGLLAIAVASAASFALALMLVNDAR